jgi:hypothetical protein
VTTFVTDAPMESMDKALQATFDFDRRLIESALAFGNGDGASECFGWVAAAVQARARAAGFPDVAALNWRLGPVDSDGLRWKFRVALGRSSELERSGEAAQPVWDSWFTDQVAEMQIVSKWHVVKGKLIEVPVPRINTVERCLAYAIGIYLLDRHGFRRAIKQCPFIEDPFGEPLDLEDKLKRAFDWHAAENIRRMPHWFLQWPLTKQQFCTAQHAATFRQRLKRARDLKAARKHK